MEVKSGYTQTDAGLTPQDWKTTDLGNLGTCVRGVSYDPGVDLYPFDTDSTIRLLRANNVQHSKIVFADMQFVGRGRVSADQLLQANDVLICMANGSRDLVGKSARFIAFDGFKYTFGAFMGCFRPDSSAASPDFVNYLFHTETYRNHIAVLLAGSSINNLTSDNVKALRVCIPSDQAEQEAIAEALSDADALIDSLEQLVVKKRQLKQGAMQSLLRPEPTDEVRLLGDVSFLKGRIGWQGLKQTEFTTNGDEPFLITGMNFKDGAIRWSEVYHISNARYQMAPEIQLRPNDVLMTKDGTIGKVLYIDTIPYPGKASLNSHLLLFRPIRGSYNPRYLYYQLGSRRFRDFVELSKSGTTFFGLSQAAVAAYPVVLPPMSKQAEIAAVLSDMDTETAAVEAKLTKATQLKQGMMQELLTGKVRLV